MCRLPCALYGYTPCARLTSKSCPKLQRAKIGPTSNNTENSDPAEDVDLSPLTIFPAMAGPAQVAIAPSYIAKTFGRASTMKHVLRSSWTNSDGSRRLLCWGSKQHQHDERADRRLPHECFTLPFAAQPTPRLRWVRKEVARLACLWFGTSLSSRRDGRDRGKTNKRYCSLITPEELIAH